MTAGCIRDGLSAHSRKKKEQICLHQISSLFSHFNEVQNQMATLYKKHLSKDM